MKKFKAVSGVFRFELGMELKFGHVEQVFFRFMMNRQISNSAHNFNLRMNS